MNSLWPPPITVQVTEPSQVGEARRLAAGFAAELHFDEISRSNLAIVVTEAANNLVKHAQQGEILLQRTAGGEPQGIEVLVLDRGPGIPDVERCFRDGYSTAGTPGTGLGAMQRLSSTFDLHSVVGTGTALLARLWQRSAPSQDSDRKPWLGAVSLPMPGETVCGDAWAAWHGPGRSVLMIADGLGHGEQAAIASREAVQAFEETSDRAPSEILRAAHARLRATRGAAMTIVEIDSNSRQLRSAGIGNVAGCIFAGGESRSLVSMPGIVGAELRRVQEFVYPWPQGAVLVLWSDGLVTQVRPDRSSGLLSRDPSLIAGALMRDHRRGRDDATVLVGREAD